MTKYKYTRKELIKKWRNTESISFEHDLLAQKEDRKEKWNENVEKCSGCGIHWKKTGKQCPVCYKPLETPTPSPLEIEKIEYLTLDFERDDEINLCEVQLKLNQVIERLNQIK